MDGLVAAGIAAVVALLIFAWAVTVRLQERRLLRRLMPVQARVIDQGTTPQTSVFVSTDANGVRTERIDTEYTGRYEYRIAGQTHVGTVTSAAPAFTDAQMPPHLIAAYYDRDNPAVSRLSAQQPDPKARLLTIFGCVVLAVAALLALIPNIDRMLAAFVG